MKKELGRGLYGMLDLPAARPTAAAPSSVTAAAVSPRLIYEPLFAARVPVVQLRMKGAEAAAMLAVLSELRERRPPDTLLIVNDRLDVALAGDADGVHLGQEDLPLKLARRICADCGRPDFLIGISTHNEEQATAALSGSPDYIALGPIYPTPSKANPDPVVGPARLAALCRRSKIPVVAIGGITMDRVPEIAAAGAHCAAMIHAINQASDILAAVSKVQHHFGNC
jgi:thiamine-phosphate pyrophosphorylase